MFGWLKSWFVREDPLNVYKPKERFIYQYFNGEKMISADPMILWKLLMEVGPELDIDIKLGNSAHKDAPKGRENAVKKIRRIFSLKTPEGLDVGNTLGWYEVMELFDHFMLFANSLKKNSSPTQTTATEISDNIPSLSEGNQPTSNTSDSGSIGIEPVTEESKQFASEQPLPSAS